MIGNGAKICRSYFSAIAVGWITCWMVGACGDVALAADARVEVELFTTPGSAATELQRWSRLFGELGVDSVRIRGSRAGDRVELVAAGTKDRPTFRVRGMLTARNRVRLPGGEFSISQRGAIGQWLEGLGKSVGEDEVEGNPWELAPEVFEAVWNDLARGVDVSTVEMSRRDVMLAIGERLEFPLVMDAVPPSRGKEACGVELKGVACGTALALLLDEVGFGFRPTLEAGGAVQYVACRKAICGTAWPVGWPAEGSKRDVLPKLFDVLTADVGQGVKLTVAVAAIGEKLEAPIFFDRAGLSATAPDWESAVVSLPRRKLTYSSLLGKLLGRLRLKYELRVDERERPFLWVRSALQ